MNTIQDVLQATKPPIELIDHLYRYQHSRQLPSSTLAWLERWQRIYAGQPDPMFDKVSAPARVTA